jgi:hypothetical protein
MFTHDVITVSYDYFTITRDTKNNVFYVSNTHDAESDISTMTIEQFRTVFVNDPKILKLFGV